ncbi:SWI/SNF-related matrix-associated actin-dependent regulator of chromatin subfamily D member 3 isoform 6-T8 [Cyanocitta cristata]
MQSVYPDVLPVLVSVSQLIRAAGSAVQCLQWECARSSEQHVSCTSLDYVSLPWGVLFRLKRPGMPSGARMPHQGGPMGPPGPPYVGSPSVRPGMPQTVMETTRKRTAPQQVQQQQVQQQVQQQQQATQNRARSAKRRKMADKILPQRIRELVPESQAYMDLLAFERKLDQTIMRKRVDIQEALKRPMKQKRKLRLYISNTFNPAKSDADDSDGSIASWELRVEGKLLDDLSKQKRKFSSFFKSLVIELDKDLYGPDNHLVEWHRTPTTQETDGFQVKRPGDVSVRCTLLLMLDYQPPQFKLDPRLARLLGIHTQTRSAIIQALWQYIKTNKLQDSHDKEYINCDKYFQQIFDCPRLKFSEIPQRLTNLLLPPDPIVINHIIRWSLLCFSLHQLPLILSLGTTEKILALSSLNPPFKFW